MPRANKAPSTSAQEAPEPLPLHPLADMFPPMGDAEFRELAADIKQHGLRELIVTFEEKVIDGRHRARACAEVGVQPEYRPFQGEAQDVVAFIVSANMHRRHLTPEDKREVIARLLQANPEKSDRALAGQMKVDKNVVTRVRKKVEATTGASAPVEKRIGQDNKARKQPARNRKPSGTAKSTKGGPKTVPLNALAWSENTDPEKRQHYLGGIGLDPLLKAMPATWKPQLENHVLDGMNALDLLWALEGKVRGNKIAELLIVQLRRSLQTSPSQIDLEPNEIPAASAGESAAPHSAGANGNGITRERDAADVAEEGTARC